jgi:hypothetical protein
VVFRLYFLQENRTTVFSMNPTTMFFLLVAFFVISLLLFAWWLLAGAPKFKLLRSAIGERILGRAGKAAGENEGNAAESARGGGRAAVGDDTKWTGPGR